MDTVRESAPNGNSGRKKKNPCRIGKSNLPQRRAGPTLYQLSYIPICILGTLIGRTGENTACSYDLVIETI